MSDDFVLVVDGVRWGGWTSASITRGIERMPSSFVVELTERNPSDGSVIDIKPGSPCQVLLGSDPVLTGYIDRYDASISAESHTVRIVGRSKSEDMVDCSAEWNTSQISSTSALDLAQKLAKPYGITVSSLSGPGVAIPQFNIQLTESAWDILERAARYSKLLAYDDTDGNVLLAQVGATKAAGGLSQGVNVQSASVSLTMDQRFAEITVVPFGTDTLQDQRAATGTGGDLVSQSPSAKDPGVRPDRKLVIVSEQILVNDVNVAQARADWEVARRYGRSQAVRVVTDSWRDGGKKLWAPNTLVDIDLPTLKLVRKTWCISEITYSRAADGGTVAEIELMPPEAFQPELELLNAYDQQLIQATTGANPYAGTPNTPSRGPS